MVDSFEERLTSGSFQVVARVVPPKSADFSTIVALAFSWKGKVGGILVADNPSAVTGVSSLLVAHALKREGHDVILVMSCRDRNRIDLGSMALGAAAASISSILSVSGDFTHWGDHPEAKPVYDLDSVQLIGMLREMGNGQARAGSSVAAQRYCVGAAACPAADPLAPQLMKIRKKVAAGVDFFITLPIFTVAQLTPFLDGVKDLPIKVIAGVLLPSYQEIARYRDGSIPGTFIPEGLVTSWREVGEEVFSASTATHVGNLIAELRDSGKVAGVCVSASGRESEIEGLL